MMIASLGGKGWFGSLASPSAHARVVPVGDRGRQHPEVLRNTVIIGVIAADQHGDRLFAGWALGRRRLPGRSCLALFLLPP